MATYAALVSAAQTLDEFLHLTDLDRSKQHITKSLLQHFISWQAFLQDFPQDLERRIRDVACKSEDLIEDCMLIKHIFRNPTSQESNRLQGLVIQDLEKLTPEILSIEKEVRDLSTTNNSSSMEMAAPPPSTIVKDDVMVGFDDQLRAIKFKLCGESMNLQIVPIFGMGGIGKTTLARNAFDDRLSKEKFDLRAWATVSQSYSTRQVFLSLLVSSKVLNDRKNDESDARLGERLYKSLKGRRYLIVLDDVWSTEAWDELSRMFPDDNNGSRVLLTTRLSQVAEYATAASGSLSDSLLHSMKFLNVDESWNLLRAKVFSTRKSDEGCCSSSSVSSGVDMCPPELEDIGKEIARRCGGLPLTIVVVAGILQNMSRTRGAWEEIARKVNEAAAETDKRVANMLTLSYRHLPHHLRPCFLYMAGFPKDYEIPIPHLLKMWIADGFLRPSTSVCLEEMAEQHLEELVRRSLVLVEARNMSGKIKSCRIHDLLREMCITKAREENFLLRVDKKITNADKTEIRNIQNLRRVSIDNYTELVRNFDGKHGSSIRTILLFDESKYGPLNCVEPKFLRVFHAPDIRSGIFPLELLQLFQIRYLNLGSFREDVRIRFRRPSKKMRKLQTLVLDSASVDWYVHMPTTLRHLETNTLYLRINNEAFFLENLQIFFEVCYLKCSEAMVKLMPNLKRLGLSYWLSEKPLSEYQLENLVHLHHLKRLDLDVRSDKRLSLLPNFAPPPTLRKLVLMQCRVEWEEIGIIASSLPNLVCLRLETDCCFGRVWETKEGQFLQLKKLQLETLNLETWITESCHFPCLERLVLHDCPNLIEIPDDIGETPTLQSIKIAGSCTESVVESAKRIKTQQQDMGGDSLAVKIYHLWKTEDGQTRYIYEEF